MQRPTAIPAAAVALGLGAAAATLAATSPFGWSAGRAPVAIGGAVSTAEQCGRCHAEQLADWSASRHRVAHTNALYQAGLVAETSAFCVHCHSPLREQTAEVLANLRWYGWQDPRHRHGSVPPERIDEPLAAEGVTCAVCHLRDGQVLVAELPDAAAPHPMRVEPGLRTEAVCEGCHEFGMPRFDRGTFTVTDTPMQSTVSEWRAWREEGGEQTCQDCHMPQGRHLWFGAHDRERLAEALSVRVRRRGGGLRFDLASVGVGHDLPTGDLFRAITVQVRSASEGGWEVVHRLGRTFEVVQGEAGVEKVPTGDTRLRPGEIRRFDVEAPPGAAWRVIFHYGSPNDEARGVLPDAALYAVLAEGP